MRGVLARQTHKRNRRLVIADDGNKGLLVALAGSPSLLVDLIHWPRGVRFMGPRRQWLANAIEPHIKVRARHNY